MKNKYLIFILILFFTFSLLEGQVKTNNKKVRDEITDRRDSLLKKRDLDSKSRKYKNNLEGLLQRRNKMDAIRENEMRAREEMQKIF